MSESYASRLPPEIWCEIFTLCLAESTPLFLGKICTAWRNIVWSTPDLWSSVFLVLSSSKFDSQLVLLEVWLIQSGHFPLSIRIDVASEEVWEGHSPADVIRIIATYSARWHHVDLALPASSLHGLTPQKDRFPLLSSIVIRSGNPDAFLNDNGESPESPVKFFCLAPHLTHVRLCYSCSPSKIDLPWQQLTHFSCDISHSIEFLRQTPELTHCTLKTLYNLDPVPHPILLPHLVSLTMNDSLPAVILHMLKSTTLPALRDLTLLQRYGAPFPDTQFHAFLTRSSCSLECLQWRRIFIKDSQLSRCLQSMPSLVEFDMGIWNDSYGSSIDHFLWRAVLPKLKSFAVDYGGQAPERGQFMDALTCPSVERVSLRGYRPPLMKMVISHPAFLRFLKRSSRLLCYLSIDNLVISGHQLRLYLQCMPSLVELKICQPRTYTTRILDLTPDDIIPLLRVVHPNPMIPNLRAFEYQGAPIFDGEELESVLSSRWRIDGWIGEGGGEERGIVHLKFVTIVSRVGQKMELSEQGAAKLRVLIDEGMMLSLTNSDGESYL